MDNTSAAPMENDSINRRSFRYDELPSTDSLRILSLHPGRAMEPLVVSLETVSGVEIAVRLADCEALSYVWGDPARTQFIICNSMWLRITLNLQVALRAIRQPTEKILLWADAICINQDNVDERNSQIQMMARIYSSAKRVLVWLGASENAKAAVQAIKRVANDPPYVQSATRHTPGIRPLLDSLRQVASCGWFNRMWTMQEIGLASDAIILYGTARIEWRELYWAYKLFEKYCSRDLLLKFSFEPERVTCLYDWSSTELDSFLKLLTTTQTRATTDPRDRVFALLSHPSATKSDGATKKLIEADYNKSVIDIYMTVAMRLIETSRCLDILSYVRGQEKEVGLPTWAPMWNHQMRVAHCLLDSHVTFSADGHSSSTTTWAIPRIDSYMSGQLEPYRDQYIYNHQLHVMSVTVGRISWCFKNPAMEQYNKWLRQTDNRNSLRDPMVFELSSASGLLSVLEQVKKQIPMQQEHKIIQTFGEVLTCGTIHPHYEDKAHKLLHPSDYEEYLDSVKEEHSNRDSRAELETRDYSFQNAIDYACEGRVLFCTDTGFMGLGPASVRIGDEACILKGGKVPYILREAKDDYHHLVGECYISGVMDGQLADTSQDDRRQITRKTII